MKKEFPKAPCQLYLIATPCSTIPIGCTNISAWHSPVSQPLRHGLCCILCNWTGKGRLIIKHAPNRAGQKSFSVLNEKGHFRLNENLSKHTNFWMILPRKLSSTFTLALDYFYFSSVFTQKQNLSLFYVYINTPVTASKVKENQKFTEINISIKTFFRN